MAIVLVLVKGVERKMRVRFLVFGFGFLIYLFFWDRDAREGLRVLMSLRVDFGPMG